MLFDSYQTQGFHDEMFDAEGNPRPEARLLLETIQSLEDGQLLRSQRAAERLLLQMGITFNVYGDSAGTEKIFPFDLIPRIVRADEWEWIERGLKQRIHALNEFIDDIYHEPEDPQGQDHPRRSHPFGHVLSSAMRRHQSSAGRVVSHHGHRSRAPRRRPDLCSRRQSSRAVGRFLRSRESRFDEADFPAVCLKACSVRPVADVSRQASRNA